MKNKKYLSILIVFLALLFISIGYAAISKELLVNGGATTQKEGVSDDDTTSLAKNFVVLWDKDTKVIDDTFAGNAKTEVTILDDLNAKIEITELSKHNAFVTVTLKIRNDSKDLKASIPLPVVANSEERYFSVTTDWVDTVLLPGESKEVTILVELIRSPLDHTSGTFTIKFTADAVETD
jgi:hypothetical protein